MMLIFIECGTGNRKLVKFNCREPSTLNTPLHIRNNVVIMYYKQIAMQIAMIVGQEICETFPKNSVSFQWEAAVRILILSKLKKWLIIQACLVKHCCCFVAQNHFYFVQFLARFNPL